MCSGSRKRRNTMEKYRFTNEQRTLIESLPIPYTICQLVDGKMAVLLLTDGLRAWFGYEDLAAAYRDLEDDLFQYIHPDDASEAADAVVRLAADGGEYAASFRMRAKNSSEYRAVHAAGKLVSADTGIQLAHIWFTDKNTRLQQANLNPSQEVKTIAELKDTILSLLDNMPGMTFTKDAETGVYLACNQAFAEYARKETPAGVAGLTDAQIFDTETAAHFVADDKLALSMDEPFIFFEDVLDPIGNQRQFQTTKLKYTDSAGRQCVLGMCQDVTDLVRIQRENATTRDAYEKTRDSGIVYSQIAQTLAKSYLNLFYVNLETEEFIEYLTDNAHDTLVEARRGTDFFAKCLDEAEIYVHPEDRAAFTAALERSALIEALDRDHTLKLIYRLVGYFDAKHTEPYFVSMQVSRMVDNENNIVIAVTDVDEQVKQRRKAEQLAFNRINALSGDFLYIYVVSPDTERYREYSAMAGFESFALPKYGENFFRAAKEQFLSIIHPDDQNRFLSLFTRERVLSEIERSGIFALSFRFLFRGEPVYVQLKAAMVEENEGPRIVVGINDIDSQVRQEQEYEKRLAQARSEANIDALTGVKNKHAYLEAEERLNRQIAEHRAPKFAVVFLDVNDLKKVNDTAGHQAGDRYLCDACSIICDIFQHSPIFRIGGDEFAVIVQGRDYEHMEELLGKVSDHNTKATLEGGIVIACGMAKYVRDSCVASVFERADKSMYENKNALKTGKKST